MIHVSHQRSVDVAKAEAKALRGNHLPETEREKVMLIETGIGGVIGIDRRSWKIVIEGRGRGRGTEIARRVAAKRGMIMIEKGLERETGIGIGIGGEQNENHAKIWM